MTEDRIELLLRKIKSSVIDERVEAARELGDSGDSRAIEPIIKMLIEPYAVTHDVTREALEKLKGHVTEKQLMNTVDGLGEEDSDRRYVCAVALGIFGRKETVEPLIERLRDENVYVCREAAKSLGKLGDRRAVGPLIEVSKDNERIRDIKKIQDEEKRIVLRQNHGDARRAAIKALGKIGDLKALETLIGLLEENWLEIRDAAAWALGKLKDARAVDPLIKVLGEKPRGKTGFGFYIYPRHAAADALVEIGDPKGILFADILYHKELVWDTNGIQFARILYHEKKERVLQSVEYIDTLIMLLKAKNSQVRHTAAYALGESGDSSAVNPLIEALEDEDKDVRAAVADGLGKIGDARAVAPLIKALKDEEKYLSGPKVHKHVISGLVRMGIHAIETVINVLDGKDTCISSWEAEEILDGVTVGKIKSTDKKFLEEVANALSDRLSTIRDEELKGKISTIIEKLKYRQLELAAKELEMPKLPKRRKPKRKIWRLWRAVQ